uniref:Kazal-like domain-containing protein n=1 Tax=Glossina pallidipes TaxID=7398 RepID=A0A1A9ZQW4_GLOPL
MLKNVQQIYAFNESFYIRNFFFFFLKIFIDDQVTCEDVSCSPKQVCLKDSLTHKPRRSPCRYKCSRKRHSRVSPTLSAQLITTNKICGVNNRTYNSWCEMRKDSCATGFSIDLKHAGECL